LRFLHEDFAGDDFVLELAFHLGRDRTAGLGQLGREGFDARLGHRLAVDDGDVLRQGGHGDTDEGCRHGGQENLLHWGSLGVRRMGQKVSIARACSPRSTNSCSASYTSRWRATRERLANKGEAIRTRK